MDNLSISKVARVLSLSLGIGFSCFAQRYAGPQTPEESLKKINIAKGLKVQLYAAEPYVLDPVDLQFDDQGNAYVVEMPDYPFEVEPGKGKGQIRKLIDTDGDGRVDKAVVFADHITEGTSILPWKGGLIITAAPYILYLKDTNGDGKADVRQVLFSGFFSSNSEAQVTGLRFGVDNWIYANNRGSSGMITFVKKPGSKPIQVQGADFRFRLDRNQFELETGPGQFGQTIDDWGHRFFTENSIHAQQSIIPWRYTHRHGFLPTSAFNVSITDHKELMFQKTVTPYWRAERSRRRNAAFKENGLNRVEYERDHFTGAAGGVIYNGTGLPKEFYGNYFVTDVAGSLLHRDILTPSTKIPALVASRPASEQDSEFLSSTDTWFRPITISSGPDGYMYLVDYYRQHIETPVSIEDDLKADMDFMAGSDKGRIYRILPEDANYKAATINFRKMSSAQLVPYLANPNGWYITTAHRLLIERQDKTVIPVVKAFLAKTQDPRARLHAIYVLEGLHALNAQIVKKALDDQEAGVRENALILAERYPELLPQVIQKTDDPAYRVAFQAVLSLGNFSGPQVTPTLIKVLKKYGEDTWFRTAVLSSNIGSSVELNNALASDNNFFQNEEPWKLAFVGDLSNVIGARNNKAQVAAYLSVLDNQKGAWLLSSTKGLAKGLQRSTTSSDELKATLSSAKIDTDASCKQLIASLKKVY
ncbi:PVC-type heme-binding CxxCH protein [Mucilaginibacter boryungensis]|uniref:Dehydrogenase n=1 Tax=Mucilaginibacter boryungensis TaxID=768480 RepID=A0ABR9XE71_9SPHI|nr:PVC-type heme-binding CxxCH protein [Mucilaginibacter boryungensis]MBE9665482.1 dehydrogenase [Mucilaginibacter boryungensis]